MEMCGSVLRSVKERLLHLLDFQQVFGLWGLDDNDYISMTTTAKFGDDGTSSGTRILFGPSRHADSVERWSHDSP